MRELWQWENEAPHATAFGGPPAVRGARDRRTLDRIARTRVAAIALWNALERPARLASVAGIVLLLAAAVALGPDNSPLSLRERLRSLETDLSAREGELRHLLIEADRYRFILEQSARYGVPGDLASTIHDIAVAEGIDPRLAFALVRVESGFVGNAVSDAGAVGLTQVMPSTASALQPGLTYVDLFQRETNLRLGFRYLRQLLRQYDGDLRLALLAYNRGPTRVDEIRRRGEDPGNGYARSIMGRAATQ